MGNESEILQLNLTAIQIKLNTCIASVMMLFGVGFAAISSNIIICFSDYSINLGILVILFGFIPIVMFVHYIKSYKLLKKSILCADNSKTTDKEHPASNLESKSSDSDPKTFDNKSDTSSCNCNSKPTKIKFIGLGYFKFDN